MKIVALTNYSVKHYVVCRHWWKVGGIAWLTVTGKFAAFQVTASIKIGRRSHLRLSRVSNCFPFLRLQSSRQSVLRTWKTSSKKKVLDASRNWSKISTSDSHIVDEFGELYFNFQQHVPDLWLLLLKVEEKDAKNELQSPFLWFLVVANEHKQPLLLGHREHSSRYHGFG